MTPDDKILLEQCDEAFKAYLLARNNANQKKLAYLPTIKKDLATGECVFVSSELVKAHAKS